MRTFDFDRRASLDLTYHTHGDRRRRGLELVRLKRRYAEAALPVTDDELPDFLPMLLEFAALAPAQGEALLNELRAPLELLREAARDGESVRRPAGRARCRPAQADEGTSGGARRLAEEGPSGKARRAGTVRRGGAGMSRLDFFLDRAPVRLHRDVRRRARVALPPRPVRVDGTVDPAAERRC